jgi:endonuclease/exonuclease/phosphatase family metal-dependent hydrolase
MKLITLNTWQGRISRNFGPFFKAQQADIICLQELHSSNQPITNWLDTFKILETINQASALDNQYYSPTFSYSVMGVEVQFGNGILSRYSLNNKRTAFTHSQYTKLAQASDDVHNTRNAQIVTVHSPSGDLTIVNTHAHWETNPMGSDLSGRRLAKLSKALEEVQGPMIVAGDFNLKSETAAIQDFQKGLNLKNLTEEYGITNTLNNLVTPHKVACDYIFINDSIDVTDFRLNETLLSDHKALILDFDIRA